MVPSCTVGLSHGGDVSPLGFTTDSEQALMSTLSQQPVSFAIKADQSSSCCSRQVYSQLRPLKLLCCPSQFSFTT